MTITHGTRDTVDHPTGGPAALDRKGIAAFLAITFGLTYAVEGALIATGFRVEPGRQQIGQMVVALVMWVPALAAWLTARHVTREGMGLTRLRIGPRRPYVEVALAIPACFAVIYAVTWAAGLGGPDWQMRWLADLVASVAADAGPGTVPATGQLPPPMVFWPILLVASTVAAPFVNGLFGLGEELGWRGYLLPKLLPLGKPRAYLLLGVIWGLWHLPLVLVGFAYPGHPWLGMAVFVGLTTAFGWVLNELCLRYDSSVLAGWAHGVFNSQRFGVWGVLFPTVNPLLGGFSGLIGIVVWLALGWWLTRRYRQGMRRAAVP